MMQIRSRICAATLLLACLSAHVPATNAGTLLPNGMQYFTDANGLPLSAGCVYFYVPNTLTPKNTYQDAAQTQLNTNPVQLDASGRAIIYGTGVYRQIVKAPPCGSQGVQIWDQITTDTSASATIYAGASAGTPNAITVNAPSFSGGDGQVINFISTNTNTGPATLNPSGFGAIQIVRDSSIGAGALAGGELVATNSVSVIYDATAGTFHILSPVTWPNLSGVPVGSVIPVAGFTAPTNYAFTYGQAVSRTTYSFLFSALTYVQTGTLTSGSAVITGLSDISQFGVGQAVEAVGIPAGATVASCTGTSCTLSANATASRTGAITFFAYGNGDGSTTFNLPDYRGLALAGRDNMGGGTKGQLTATYFGSAPTILGKIGGAQAQSLSQGQLPNVTIPASVTGTVSVTSSGTFFQTSVAPVVITDGSGSTNHIAAPNGATTGANTVSSSGSNTLSGNTSSINGNVTQSAFTTIQPTAIVNFAIRLVP